MAIPKETRRGQPIRKAALSFVVVAGLGLIASHATAETRTSLEAYFNAINTGNAEACTAAFAADARFIDLGNDFSARERREWFCREVISVSGRYTVSELAIVDGVASFDATYVAGAYRATLVGKASVVDGLINSFIPSHR